MGKNKKPPKKQMKYWSVGHQKNLIKARTARAAVRKYIRGSLDYYIAVIDYELWNPHNPSGDTPESVQKEKNFKRWVKKDRRRLIENVRVSGPFKKNH